MWWLCTNGIETDTDTHTNAWTRGPAIENNGTEIKYSEQPAWIIQCHDQWSDSQWDGE